jgi:hypothetical protein
MSNDNKAPPRREGQDSYRRFSIKLFDALSRLGISVEDIEKVARDDGAMVGIGDACALAIRELTSATDAALDSVPTNRIIPANLVVNLQATPKLFYKQEPSYHCRVPPSWTFDRRQLRLDDPVKRLGIGGSVSGMEVWERTNKLYGHLLPNANILDVFLMYPSLVPAAWNARCFYAFGTKIETDGCEWIRGLRQVRGAWEQVMERLDRPWVPNDMVLIFKTSE